MNKFTNDQHVKIVEFYYSSGKSIIQTQRKFRNNFNVREQPSEDTIRNLIARFQPQTREELKKKNISEEIATIDQGVLSSVMYLILERARHCEEANGGHLQDIIFHN